MAKTANIRTFAALEDQSGITSEREQLLLHTEGTEECRRRKSAANDGRSNQCQHCGRNTVIPTPKPRYEIGIQCCPAYLTLTFDTAGTVRSSPSAPGSPKPTLRTLKPEPGSKSSRAEGPLYLYKFLSRLQYSYSIYS